MWEVTWGFITFKRHKEGVTCMETNKMAMQIASSIMPIMGGAIGEIVKGVTDSLNAEHESDLARIKADHEAKIKAITERDAKQLAEANKALDDYIAKSNKSYEEYTEKLAELDKDVEALKASHEAEIAELNKKNEELEKQLEAAKAGVPMPEKPKKKGGKKNAIKHYMFDKVLALVKQGRKVYLNGDAGAGKNVIAEQVAEELGLDFYISGKVADEYGLKGFVDANGNYIETPFFKAFTRGGLFLFDEMDASNPDALVALGSALANGYFDFPKYGVLYAHKDFRVIANGNTAGTGADERYTGRYALDNSTLDRFRFLQIDYDEKIELACADGDATFVQFVHDVRNAVKKMGNNCLTISYRGISNYINDYHLGVFTDSELMKMDITKGLDRDNIELIVNNLKFKSNRYAKILSNLSWGLENAA